MRPLNAQRDGVPWCQAGVSCPAPALWICDARVGSTSCNASLCEMHATRRGDYQKLCPQHANEHRPRRRP